MTRQTREAPVLAVSGLTKHYGERRAVRGVSFEIRSGEIVGLLGANGAGKTTTIGMVAAIVRCTHGEIRINGQPVDGLTPGVRSCIGLVPQSLCLYPSLTAEENLTFFGRMYGLEKGELGSRVEALLDFIGLANRRQDRVETFSGGMKRRLNLACGLVHRPRLLLLDEPTVGVDPQSRERIFAMVEGLVEAGMAVLYTTHYMEEAERLCHRVAIMDEGEIIAEGKVRELAGLVEGGRSLRVAFERRPSPRLLSLLREKGARDIRQEAFQMPGESIEETVSDILRAASADNNPIRDLVIHRPDLGEVFLHLTGKELRD